MLIMSSADMSDIVCKNANLLFLPKPFNGLILKRERARS